MSKLTEDEREKLIHHIGAWRWESRGLARCEERFIAEVDAILTDRLARVEALADEWERKADNAIAHDQMMRAGRLTHAARRLRAALAAAPSREGDQ